MTQIPVFSITGAKLTPVTVPDKIFKAKINPVLMAQAVRVYLNNQRQAAARTKNRGEIKVTHAKVWRQKGTGRARHGSRNAPVFVGGAKAHGPAGTQNYWRKLNQKQKRASLHSALSLKFKNKQIICLSGWEKLKAKTKIFDQLFTKLKLNKNNLWLLLDKPQTTIKRATANLPYLRLELANNLTTYSVLKARTLIFTRESLQCLK
jgi:large subunit ribosomal protein L4